MKTTIKKNIALIIFGAFSAAIIIEAALQIGGFVISRLKEYKKQTITPVEGEYRILCIGESTTEWGREESYPKQLERILNTLGKEKYRVINEGATACNTTMVFKKLKYNLEKYKPQMVIAMMGINDRFLESEFTDFAVFQKTPFLKNLKLYKFFKWWQAFAKSKAIDAGETNINDSGNKEIIATIKDMKDNIEKARCLMELGEYEKAMALFKKETKINPRNTEAWEGLWRCYEDNRKIDNNLLGSFIDENFKLLDRPQPCVKEPCLCENELETG